MAYNHPWKGHAITHMDYQDFLDELHLEDRVLGITRLKDAQDGSALRGGCALAALQRALSRETVIFTRENVGCTGANAGFGFSDELPLIPGGIGDFLAQGHGEGFPAGEHVKRTPALGEAVFRGQPQGVMKGYAAIQVGPYAPYSVPDTVTCLVNCDQLSALIHLFCFESAAWDNVITPMVSGCASIFRIPFGELSRAEGARAVIGNVDVFSRPHFPADSLFFTVPGTAFARMLSLLDESVLTSPIWRGVRDRL